MEEHVQSTGERREKKMIIRSKSRDRFYEVDRNLRCHECEASFLNNPCRHQREAVKRIESGEFVDLARIPVSRKPIHIEEMLWGGRRQC